MPSIVILMIERTRSALIDSDRCSIIKRFATIVVTIETMLAVTMILYTRSRNAQYSFEQFVPPEHKKNPNMPQTIPIQGSDQTIFETSAVIDNSLIGVRVASSRTTLFILKSDKNPSMAVVPMILHAILSVSTSTKIIPNSALIESNTIVDMRSARFVR